MSVGSLVSAGPLLLAIPVAAAAGAVTFLSPCVLPLVPGYLSYITGMSGASAHRTDQLPASTQALADPDCALAVRARPSRSRVLAGATLFIVGFSVLFAIEGVAFGGVGMALRAHQQGLSRALGLPLIGLGLLFAGAFDRFGLSGRIVKPSIPPRAWRAAAPLPRAPVRRGVVP